jgi:uncharacterized protein (DUF1697 family)
MSRLIAFLRAINVGGHTVKMERLRALFAELGYERVETFIASGNVIFDAPAAPPATVERAIEVHLHRALGYEVATFIRTAAELAAVAAHQPFPAEELAAEGASLFVTFMAALPAEATQERVLALRNPVDDFAFHGRELYWLRRTREGESITDRPQFARAFGKEGAGTTRNITTVRRLAAKYPPGQ